ncbi:hypothetical protein [Candidatus Chlamydia sanziniae]|uniref:Nucleoside phosphorylase domain-containing protein n=1 Tax=Candidatus Chlamydia sanziniae TaxID=1806891 RepID=A0A1A9HYM3_9CHLA|nr:hypothetical protein [Candidatus Chlamydia sanziniae]ANH79144.1 hypothetical protein Cs308_0974 [Candidatus Chlamydia sanziniae]
MLRLSNTLPKILCIIADDSEARPLLEQLSFQHIDVHLYRCKPRNPPLLLDVYIVDHWGGPAVLAALETYPQALTHYDLWINMGFAGSCSIKLSLGTCYTVNCVAKLNQEPIPNLSEEPKLFPIPIDSLPRAFLVTTHVPYCHGFHKTFQLVDMEGYAIALQATKHQIPYRILKIASDYTLPNSSQQIRAHTHQLAIELSEVFIKILPEIFETTIASTLLSRTPPLS